MSGDKIANAPFNMAMLFYQELHRLRMMKYHAILEGRIDSYYDFLEQIYIQISFNISEDEAKELDKMFEDCRKYLNNKVRGSQAEEYNRMGNLEAKQRLKKVDIRINKLMNKYKMIFPNIEVDGIGKLNERYGLDVADTDN